MDNKNGLKQIVLIVLGIVIAVGLLFGITLYFKKDKKVEDVGVTKTPKVISFVVDRPYFVVGGINLEKINIYGVPMGTNVSESSHLLISTTTVATEKNDEQIWKGLIPQEPILLSDIYAVGFDELGKKTERLYFSLRGATDIYNALWVSTMSSVLEISLEKDVSANGIKFSLDKVYNDSRCAKDVTCITAGNVFVDITANGYGEMQKIKLDLDKNKTALVMGQRVSLENVSPENESEKTIKQSEYIVTILVEQESK